MVSFVDFYYYYFYLLFIYLYILFIIFILLSKEARRRLHASIESSVETV